MSRSTLSRPRAAAALLSAAVAAVVTFGGTAVATAEPFAGPTGTQHVGGAILDTYRGLGSQYGPLGLPWTSERIAPDRIGRYNLFQGGGIYWSPGTGAHGIWGGIWGWYGLQGYEAGPLGYPTTSQLRTPDRRAVFNGFQHGAIYQRTVTLAGGQTMSNRPTQVRGAIFQRYGSLGWEAGPLGYPETDELGTPDGRGRFSAFQRGTIYFTPWTGAHAVWGAIASAYATQGWETGQLGYPLTSELPTPDGIGRFNHFERGSIYFTPDTGAHAVTGEFHAVWSAMGWENSELGYPISPEYEIEDGGTAQDFEYGWIESHPGEGAYVYLDE